ncbi:holo-ACP synthase [Neomoorella humiferrea]|uniref:holo-ACP synthase n=1 Tax=Neomoorella humiferrea TaxID=676965 RepID=UPI003D8E5753
MFIAELSKEKGLKNNQPGKDGNMAQIGIDIIEIDRLERALKHHPRLLSRLFTPVELEYCMGRGRPAASLAARFAAKEAVMKVLGVGLGGCSFRDIEIGREDGGRPRVVLHGRAEELARKAGGGTITVSLSHCRSFAAAVAIALFDGIDL